MGLIPRGPKSSTVTSSSSGGTKPKTNQVNHYHNSGGSGGVNTPLETWQILVIVFSILWFIFFCCCIYYYKRHEDRAKYKARNESTGKRARRIVFKALLLALILPYLAIKLTQIIRGKFFNKSRSNVNKDTYNSLEDQTKLLPQQQQQSQPQMREAATAESMPPAYAGASAGADGQRFEPMRVPTLPAYQQGEYNPDAAAAYIGPSLSSNAQPGPQRPRSP